MTSSDEHKAMMDAIKSVDTKIDVVDTKVDDANRALEYHIAEGHDLHVARTEVEDFTRLVREWIEESREDRQSLRESQDTMLTQHNLVMDLFLGEKKTTVDGVAYREGGFRDIVTEYMTGSQGFRVNIPWAKLTGVIVASITTAGLIIVAVIESGAGP